MSLFYDNEEYELSMPLETNNLLAELPFDLIKESIIEQIDDPVSTNINYIDIIIDKCDVFKELYANDDEIVAEINDTLKDFFIFIMERINDKFDLGLDINSISLYNDMVDIGTSIYSYFILRYSKNISKFISKFIIKNKKSIVNNFNDASKKDISTLAFKKQIKNKDDLTILINIPSIIKYIINLDIEPQDFINLSIGSNNYDGVVITNLIETDLLIGNFVRKYLDVAIDNHDYILDEIQSDIKSRIIKKIAN